MATAKSSTRRQVTWPGWTWTAKPLTVTATTGVSSGRPRPRLADTQDGRISARRRVSVTTYSSKELPHIRGELLRLLQREKVAAALEFRKRSIDRVLALVFRQAIERPERPSVESSSNLGSDHQ